MSGGVTVEKVEKGRYIAHAPSGRSYTVRRLTPASQYGINAPWVVETWPRGWPMFNANPFSSKAAAIYAIGRLPS